VAFFYLSKKTLKRRDFIQKAGVVGAEAPLPPQQAPDTATALVILAGGLGSRFGGAKQIEPFGAQGHFLFEYACYDAMQAGFQKVFIIVRPGMQEIVSQQLNRWMREQRFEIIIQEQSRPKPWGTAHALHFLFGKWEGAFLVLNADDYYGPSICQRAIELAQDGVAAAALAFELGPTLSPHGPVARGICQSQNSYLSTIEEVLKLERKNGFITDEQGRVYPSDTLISMNAWLLSGTFLEQLASKVRSFLDLNKENEQIEMYLPKVLHEMITEGSIRIKVAAMPSAWFGITYAADLALAQTKIRALEGTQYPLEFPIWI
jgi:bifunctional N-acetylglucosamine-1-phosphate-uridyltransferase/glucosamine-1-phosphate-acetyltransferase GlmU-like protein